MGQEMSQSPGISAVKEARDVRLHVLRLQGRDRACLQAVRLEV